MVEHKHPIAKDDLAKLDAYFSDWANDNLKLQRKVFFDVMFDCAHHRREGLRELNKWSFKFGKLPDECDYMQEACKTTKRRAKATKPKLKIELGSQTCL